MLSLFGRGVTFDLRAANPCLPVLDPRTFTLMPELPDITVYIEALDKRVLGERLESVRIHSPFLLRTFEPPLAEASGKTVRSLLRHRQTDRTGTRRRSLAGAASR